MEINKVLETTKFVIDNADFVKINQKKLIEFAKKFKNQDRHHYLIDSPFDLSNLNKEDKLMLILVFNSISFSYWGDKYWLVNHEGVQYTRGSMSMLASIFRAIKEGKNILDPKFLSQVSKKELAIILRGSIEIPSLNERVKILNQLGQILLEKYKGKFSNLILDANKDILKLINIIIDSFPYLKDEGMYKSKKIIFNKKVQAIVEGIYSLFKGRGIGEFKNPNSITALADYVIPALLRDLGILKYSKDLGKRIDNKIPLIKNNPEEIEIRASTIWVVEFMKIKRW